MSEKNENQEQPESHEDFGHLVMKLVTHMESDHSPGFQQPDRPIQINADFEDDKESQLPVMEVEESQCLGLAMEMLQRFVNEEDAK